MKNTTLDFTGERLVPEIEEYWSLEHLHRYAITIKLIRNKTVLDIASGEGYGSFLMSKYASKVIGMDISREAIEHAKIKYTNNNISFELGSATDIPMPPDSVDIITSFETIEHLIEHDLMLKEFKRVMKSDGILIISSPDKKYYSDVPEYHNPFHLKELYFNEFKDLLQNNFQHTVFLSQKSIVGTVMIESNNQKNRFIEFTGNFQQISKYEDILDSPLYHICIASNTSIPSDFLFSNSIFSNKDISKKYFDLLPKYQNVLEENLKLKHRVDLYKKQLNHPIIRLLKKVRHLLVN